MFTGLIKEVARVLEIQNRPDGFLLALTKASHWSDIELGESIAVDGVCLTVTEDSFDQLKFFVGEETLSKSNFKYLKINQLVNLERSLRLGDRLGGHMVSGHVDTVVSVTRVEPRGDCLWFEILIPSKHARFVIEKGSLAINGVSLTVNHFSRAAGLADFYLVPETLAKTNLAQLSAEKFVNIECDQIVKIISQQMQFYGDSFEQHT